MPLGGQPQVPEGIDHDQDRAMQCQQQNDCQFLATPKSQFFGTINAKKRTFPVKKQPLRNSQEETRSFCRLSPKGAEEERDLSRPSSSWFYLSLSAPAQSSRVIEFKPHGTPLPTVNEPPSAVPVLGY
jgi:hypothetical protein